MDEQIHAAPFSYGAALLHFSAMMTSRKRVRVDRVPLGRGVFATRDFAKGDEIGTVTGCVIDDADHWSEYCIDLGGKLSLEPRAPFRFLNHSCEPNCELHLIGGGRWPRADNPPLVVVSATRTIQAGDELRIDYAWSASGAIPCQCGSPKCRGWVVARSELAELRRSLSRRTNGPQPWLTAAARSIGG